jgi:hypothetical protein
MANKENRNVIKCVHCKDEIESFSRHDFKFCSCEKVFVDGGLDYQRIGGDPGSYIILHSPKGS